MYSQDLYSNLLPYGQLRVQVPVFPAELVRRIGVVVPTRWTRILLHLVGKIIDLAVQTSERSFPIVNEQPLSPFANGTR